MDRKTLVAIVLIGSPAYAEDPQPPDEHTAAEVAGAPRPGEESGRIDDGDGGDSALREVGRGMLVIPRAAFEIVSGPVRGGLWAYDRYQLRDRWYELFFNKDRTVGVYPTLWIDTDILGVTIGGRFVARDVLGERESVTVRAAAGGAYRSIVTGAVRTGDRFGRVELEVGGEYEHRPKDHFYGIGNGDEVDLEAPPMMLIDPLTDTTAVSTRYRQQLERTSLIVDTRLWRDLHVRGAGALADFDFSPSEYGTPIDEIYMTDRIVGFGGVRYAYGDVELKWDTRGRYTRWEPASVAAIGSLASIYAGRLSVEDGTDFTRYGGDLEYFWRIGAGPRVIATRLHGEGVTGQLDEVPFDELPKLGGPRLLRGYPTDRFRDRVAALGTLEYRWDLSWWLIASTFVDAGRVARTVSDLSLDNVRVGFGFGLEWYTEHSLVMRTSLSSSIDGGIIFNLGFDPAFDLDPRVERR